MPNYNALGNPHLGAGPGRPKGKRKLRDTNDLVDQLGELKYDAVIENVMMAREPNCPYAVRYKINETFIKYISPQLRHVDHSGTIEHNNLNISWDITTQKAAAIEHTVDLIVDETVAEPVPSDSDD